MSPRRKSGSIDTGLWNIGPGFRRGDTRSERAFPALRRADAQSRDGEVDFAQEQHEDDGREQNADEHGIAVWQRRVHRVVAVLARDRITAASAPPLAQQDRLGHQRVDQVSDLPGGSPAHRADRLRGV